MKEPVTHDGSSDAGDFRLEDFLPYRLSVAADTVTRIITRHHLAQSGLGDDEPGRDTEDLEVDAGHAECDRAGAGTARRIDLTGSDGSHL